jgi:hypothetical protein
MQLTRNSSSRARITGTGCGHPLHDPHRDVEVEDEGKAATRGDPVSDEEYGAAPARDG